MDLISTLAVVQKTNANMLAVVQGGSSSGTSNANMVIIVIIIIIIILIAGTLFGHKK